MVNDDGVARRSRMEGWERYIPSMLRPYFLTLYKERG